MILRSRARPVFRTDNLTAICKPSVYTMWDPRLLTTYGVSTFCYGNRFTCLYVGDVLTSEETHVWSSTACYWTALLLYLYMMFVINEELLERKVAAPV
jgi:hypothetical protein